MKYVSRERARNDLRRNSKSVCLRLRWRIIPAVSKTHAQHYTNMNLLSSPLLVLLQFTVCARSTSGYKGYSDSTWYRQHKFGPRIASCNWDASHKPLWARNKNVKKHQIHVCFNYTATPGLKKLIKNEIASGRSMLKIHSRSSSFCTPRGYRVPAKEKNLAHEVHSWNSTTNRKTELW